MHEMFWKVVCMKHLSYIEQMKQHKGYQLD